MNNLQLVSFYEIHIRLIVIDRFRMPREDFRNEMRAKAEQNM